MYFNYLFKKETNRLSYFFALFLFQILAIILFEFQKKIRITIVVFMLLLNAWFIAQNCAERKKGNALFHSIINTFPRNLTNCFVLNLPSYFKDQFIFRDNSRILNAIYFYKQEKIDSNLQFISNMYYSNFNDSISIEKIDSQTIVVNSKSDGTWLMNAHNGTFPYETEKINFKNNEWNLGYTLCLKEKKLKDVNFVYIKNGTCKLWKP